MIKSSNVSSEAEAALATANQAQQAQDEQENLKMLIIEKTRELAKSELKKNGAVIDGASIQGWMKGVGTPMDTDTTSTMASVTDAAGLEVEVSDLWPSFLARYTLANAKFPLLDHMSLLRQTMDAVDHAKSTRDSAAAAWLASKKHDVSEKLWGPYPGSPAFQEAAGAEAAVKSAETAARAAAKAANSGSDGQTLQPQFKHIINQDVCTYADSPAYACGEY